MCSKPTRSFWKVRAFDRPGKKKQATLLKIKVTGVGHEPEAKG